MEVMAHGQEAGTDEKHIAFEEAAILLEDHRRLWDKKPGLRAVYRHLHEQIDRWVVPGRVLEVGAGPGRLSLRTSDVLKTDIVGLPWLDFVSEATSMPVRDGVLDTIVMVDVLHHLSHPRRFFDEATRVLRPGGRVVMIEPAITPTSWFFYKFLHPEPVRMRVDPMAEQPHSSADPFDANQAIPTLLFKRGRGIQAMQRDFPELRLTRTAYLSLFAYALSGGFREWNLLPARIARWILRLEDRITPLLGRLLAFRLLVVLEMHASATS